MVGLAATSLIYEKWFHNNNYYLYQLVLSLNWLCCLPGIVHNIIDCYIVSLNILFAYVLRTIPKINIHSFIRFPIDIDLITPTGRFPINNNLFTPL